MKIDAVATFPEVSTPASRSDFKNMPTPANSQPVKRKLSSTYLTGQKYAISIEIDEFVAAQPNATFRHFLLSILTSRPDFISEEMWVEMVAHAAEEWEELKAIGEKRN